MSSLSSRVGAALSRGYVNVDKTGIQEWINKACSPDNDPPKSKHIRRVLCAMIRDKNVTPKKITKIIMTGKTWREDRRVGAKLLYLIFIAYQRLPPIEDIQATVKNTDALNRIYQNSRCHPDQEGWSKIAQSLGAVIHSKFVFHSKQPTVMPNFYVDTTHDIPETLADDLRGHLTNVCYEANHNIFLAMQTKNFAFYTLIHPIIEEICVAYPLLLAIDDSGKSTSVLSECESILLTCQDSPHLKSAVIYPQD